MKTKYKPKFDKKTKEYQVSYIKLKRPVAFRKAYLQDYLQSYDQFVISVNTNIIDKTIDVLEYVKNVEEVFKETGTQYELLSTPNTRERKLLGITVGKEKDKAYQVIAEISKEVFLEHYDLFEKVDYMIGFGLDQSFEELVRAFMMDFDLFLINHPHFEKVLYDSYVIRNIRTNFDYFPEVEAL